MKRMVNQGDIYWVSLEEQGRPISHPHVVIQDSIINSKDQTVVVCALTTNRKRAKAPGNVLLEEGEANLPSQSIVVVSQVFVIPKAQLGEYIGSLTQQRVHQILAGMQFLQHMIKHD